MSISGGAQTCSASSASICARFLSWMMSVTSPAARERISLGLGALRLEAGVALGLEHLQVLVQVGREQHEVAGSPARTPPPLRRCRPCGGGSSAAPSPAHGRRRPIPSVRSATTRANSYARVYGRRASRPSQSRWEAAAALRRAVAKEQKPGRPNQRRDAKEHPAKALREVCPAALVLNERAESARP